MQDVQELIDHYQGVLETANKYIDRLGMNHPDVDMHIDQKTLALDEMRKGGQILEFWRNLK